MERCPRCKSGILEYQWWGGCLRMVCLNAQCNAVFDAARTFLGVLQAVREAAKGPR